MKLCLYCRLQGLQGRTDAGSLVRAELQQISLESCPGLLQFCSLHTAVRPAVFLSQFAAIFVRPKATFMQAAVQRAGRRAGLLATGQATLTTSLQHSGRVNREN